jgi:hypothetical protein
MISVINLIFLLNGRWGTDESSSMAAQDRGGSDQNVQALSVNLFSGQYEHP